MKQLNMPDQNINVEDNITFPTLGIKDSM
uniref:Uncharacterized protein n=1 Tax=Rhizophora mucronata TaxID=61149 RepID=A0A2P2PBY6_RHIMU